MQNTETSRAWTVAELVGAVGESLSSRFAVCHVQGEISGMSKAGSGHCYFSLKDATGRDALIRCAMFRRASSWLDFTPADGQTVEVRGRLALYEPRGDLQFIVETMRRAGAGALYEQFLRLKAKLEAQGVFNADRKRPIPAFPRRVGVVTSLGGAALHDVVSAFARRAPQVELVVYPSLVQGPEAPAALLRALALANARGEVDSLILCRGGGSLEDLWAFNDERLVRAVADSRLPLIVGVGHETDLSLADFAADLRAPTPTAAAELAAPSQRECLVQLAQQGVALQRLMQRAIDTREQRLDRAAMRLSRPGDITRRELHRLQSLAHRLESAARRRLAGARQRLESQRLAFHAAASTMVLPRAHRLEMLSARLASVDPRQVLRRGYAWLTDERDRPIQSIRDLQPGQALTAVLHDGRAAVTVRRLQPDDEPGPADPV